MKVTSILIVMLLLASVFIPCASVAAQLSQNPHEDPSAAQSMLDSFAFLSQYAQIFSLTASKNYDNASLMNEQLSHIIIPDNLKYIINRYSNLTQQLINVLQELDGTLTIASSLLDQNRLDEAKQALDAAGVLVAKAQIILGDLKDATTTLSQRLGVFSASTASQVHDAYNTLEGMLQRLQDLIDLYHQLLNKAKQRMDETDTKQLIPSALTLKLNMTSGYVGAYIFASGVLSSNGSALGNKEIALYLDDDKIAVARTDVNGAYSTLIRIPYKYVSYVYVNALYSPQNSDREVYLGSVSPDVKVQVLFCRTLLQVATPPVAYPGLSLHVYGNVTSEEGLLLTDRQIRILLDGHVIGQAITGSTGDFVVNAVIAGQKLGVHSLTVTVSPSGFYDGVSEQTNLTVKQLASTLRISAPSIVILPSSLFVNGTITSASGALSDADIEIEFANTTINVKSLVNGYFNATIDIPFSTVFAGNQELTLTVLPNEPWQASVQETTEVLVLNSVSIGIAVASSLSVILVIYARLAGLGRSRNQKAVKTKATFTLPTQETPRISRGPAVAQIRFEGLRGRILKAYTETINVVQSVTNESLMPNMTLREYLQTTKQKLREASDLFAQLTFLGEKSLYSLTGPEELEAQTAESLASEIRRIINGKTP